MHFLGIEKVNLHQIMVSKRSIMRDVPELDKSTDFLIFYLLKLHLPLLLGDNVVKVPGLAVIIRY